MKDPLVEHFKSEWLFVRKLSLDLLTSIPESDFNTTPGASRSPWWKQFRHMGRVQENYLDAVETGAVRFGVESAGYKGGASKQELFQYLESLDKRLNALLSRPVGEITIDWFGVPKSLGQHLLCLYDHEVLHHGQWSVYVTQSGFPFPKSWEIWGL